MIPALSGVTRQNNNIIASASEVVGGSVFVHFSTPNIISLMRRVYKCTKMFHEMFHGFMIKVGGFCLHLWILVYYIGVYVYIYLCDKEGIIMKYAKYQQEIISKAIKGDLGKFHYWVENGNIYSTTDGFRVQVVPRDYWFIDLDKLTFTTKSHNIYWGSIKWGTFCGGLKDYEDSVVVEEKKVDKKTIFKLQSTENPKHFAWVDKKLIEYFDKPIFLLSKTNTRISKILVYEDGEAVGFVLPIRRDEDEFNEKWIEKEYQDDRQEKEAI